MERKKENFKKYPPMALRLFIIWILLQQTGFAGTCLSGSVYNGHGGPLTVAGSPYLVYNQVITIPDGETLTIEPGVTVLLRTVNGLWGWITVRGTLIAHDAKFSGLKDYNPTTCSGTERRIPGSWGGIYFDDADPGTILENCQVLYAGGAGIGGSIVQQGGNTNLTISNCLIAHGTDDGIHLTLGASPDIINTTIADHTGWGIFHIGADSNPVVSGCAIINNGNYAVYAFPNSIKYYHNDFILGNNPNAFQVPGGQVDSGTWEDHHDAYYRLDGSMGVKDAETLTLEPGVDIRSDSPNWINVWGTLIADGDSCRPITFTAMDTTTRWGGIRFSQSDPGTILNFCDFSFVGGGGNPATLYLNDVASPTIISNCRITKGGGIGITIAENIGVSSSPLILNNLISDNAGEGIYCNSTGAMIVRGNRIANNHKGIYLWAPGARMDLGTAASPGHNAFINNTGRELHSGAADTIMAVGNYWVDTDSAFIDQNHIYDDDDTSGVAPVIFTPFDFTDQSNPPEIVFCPPNCLTLNVTITFPTDFPVFETASRFAFLGGSAEDDFGVAEMSWHNTATGDTGNIALSAPRSNFTWNAPAIPLVDGANILRVTAKDLDGCVANDEITVNRVASAGNCWAEDSFDGLNPGCLNGQNGWYVVPGRACARVVPDPTGAGQVMELDPTQDSTIIIGKTISPQTSGRHSIELLVYLEPGDTTMAKLEVNTTGNPWNKKFQLYFGAHMRLNYGPQLPDAVAFLPRTEPQRWYHVRAEVDLATDSVDVFLDGAPVLENVLVAPGPITELSVSGWDLPGYALFDDIYACRLPDITMRTMPINSGWNLLSLPLEVIDPYYLSLFPNAVPSTLFGYIGSYFSADTLEPSLGYWLRFPAMEEVLITGSVIDTAVIDLMQGWNIIGSLSCDVALSNVSDTGNVIIPGSLYRYEGGYVSADTIKQGKGYWIRANAMGTITMSCGSLFAKRSGNSLLNLLDPKAYSLLEISDAGGGSQKLYIGVELGDPNLKLHYSLPPVPPPGSFDARFAGDYRLMELQQAIVHLQSSHYPLTVRFSNIAGEQYAIREIVENKVVREHVVGNEEQVTINNPLVKVLEVGKVGAVPVSFSVSQNYPNPFNPTTEILYTLPRAEKVSIVIYNTLGQKVKTLVSESQTAGYHSVVWDATNDAGQKVGSGMYLYRVKAGEFSAVKKMLLLK